jgi:hypothetical protein
MFPARLRNGMASAMARVVSVTSERGNQDEIEGADMGHHLARHGFKVEVTRIMRGELDAEDVLLSHAADSDADFMVMGGR